MEKKLPILGILGGIKSGIPLFKEVVGLFKKHPKTPDEVLNSFSLEGLKLHVKDLESKDEKSFIVRLGNLIITAATVYGVIWTAKHFGITSQEILDLFGLLK